MVRHRDMNPEEKRQYHRDHAKAWRIANRERAIETGKLWQAANKERFAAIKKAWRLANPEKVKAQKQRNRKRSADHIRSKNQKYQEANRHKTRAWSKKWYEENKETSFNQVYRRRHKIKEQGHRLSRGLAKYLYEAQKGLCAVCSADLAVTKYHRDHIVPIAKGGLHIDSNIQLLCPTCNLSKGAKLI